MSCLLSAKRIIPTICKKSNVQMSFGILGISHRDPFKIFNEWFIEAKDYCDPREMVLTAVLKDGSFVLQPLQCQSYSELGFKYYAMEEPDAMKNDNAALTFIWPAKRMVRIEGTTKCLPKHEVEQFFFNRIPYEEQIDMVCSQEAKVYKNKTVLEEQIDMLKKKYGKGKVPMPSSFFGYLLTPLNMEFYENAGGTFQHRLKFIKSNENREEDEEQFLYKGENGWDYQILSP